ncbi:MAG TPA: thymidylate synthase (FAD), partial [Aquificaceae bacterium]|nr:thymidylate synthase (FAD) [Aquificaceae bacterium]
MAVVAPVYHEITYELLKHIYFTFDISEIIIAISRELLEHRIASHTARSTRYN